MSPYFSPKSIIAPSFRASSIGVSKMCTGAFWKISWFTRRSTSSRSSALSAAGWVKSKRSLSGRTAEPACFTCSPSTSRSACWSRCVAVWFAIVGKRTVQGTTARTRSPAAKPSPSKSSAWSSSKRNASRSSASRSGLLVLDLARVGDLAAAVRVERATRAASRGRARRRAPRARRSGSAPRSSRSRRTARRSRRCGRTRPRAACRPSRLPAREISRCSAIRRR